MIHCGFVAALEGLEGTWAVPDPLFTFLRAVRSRPSGQLELDALAALERRSSAPTARQVREALEARLAPAGTYRVRWVLKVKAMRVGRRPCRCRPPGATDR